MLGKGSQGLRGTILASPALQEQGDLGGSTEHPGYTSRLEIAESHHKLVPVPEPISSPSAGKEPPWELARGPAELGQGMHRVSLEWLDVTGEILACCQQTAPLERGPSPAAQARMFPNLACVKRLLECRDGGWLLAKVKEKGGRMEQCMEGDRKSVV